LILLVSRPASGSVTPKQARDDPSMIDGNHFLFCSSVPCFTIECRPKMLMCTVEHAANAPAERPISCIMMEASITPSPAPPYSVGMAIPSQPPSAMALANSNGNE
jgi:hypothetical protein